ncbi:MAG: phosphoribosylamine--glycine ligase [Neisseriales bacterium]|nr:MAG: phosphoribosylamine--glycine ligase [Neisseriales bacterium]
MQNQLQEKTKKILIIGKGGREHALAWKFASDDPSVEIFVAEGNAGCELIPNVSNIGLTEIEDLVGFAMQNRIDLTVVGSEELLVKGIVDKFEANNLKIFGPDKQAAMLEGSKAYAKDFMTKYGVKTAKYQNFTDYAEALNYLKQITFPVVIKASGLAAGKGVIIAKDNDEAETALADMLLGMVFGESGSEVVIEEFLEGVEASILSFTDSKVILPLISAKDHKKIGNGETGLNTGGMGVIAPNPYVTDEVYQAFIKDILEPTLNGIKMEKMDFAGVIFFGVMITKNGVYLLEYNMRMGDPETQAVLPLMKNKLFPAINSAIDRNLESVNLEWENGATCCVVIASGGYPEKHHNGYAITGLEKFDLADSYLFAAGVGKKHNDFVTAGGRVLNVVAKGVSLDDARNKAYKAVNSVNFKDMYYRTDIGKIV